MRTNLLFCLLGCVFGVSQLRAYDVVVDGIYYTLHENGTNRTAWVVAGDEPYTGEVYLPDTIVHEGAGYPVTQIDFKAFDGCSGVTLIRIPEYMYEISAGVFTDCTELKTVLYDSRGAYYWSQRNPGWLSVETLVVGEAAECIPSGMFSGCEKLNDITFSGGAKIVGPKAFKGTAVYQDERNWRDGVLYIDRYLMEVRNPEALIGRYEVLPDTRLIADQAFKGCTVLTEVVLPDSLTAIGGQAFYGCSGLESINIPEGLEMIRESAFTGCDKLTRLKYEAVDCRTYFLNSSADKDSIGWSALTELTFGGKVKSIPYNMFRNLRRLQSVVIPPSVKQIESETFAGCTALASIVLPADMERVGSGAFDNTAFSNDPSNWENGMLYLNTCLLKANRYLQGRCEVRPGTHLLSNAFQYCSEVTEVVLPESVKYIGDYAFAFCNKLQSVNLPEGLIGLAAMCFYYCGALDSITIPRTVEWINGFAFMGAGLKRVEIWGNVKTIWRHAFSLCENMEEMRVYADIPPGAHESAFELMGNGNTPVYVQTSAYDAYVSHEVWGKFNLMRMADVKVPDPFADAEGVFVQGNEIIIGGVEALPVSVYDLSGRRVYQGCGNRISIPQAGVYLVQTQGRTVKVMIRN